jgi:malyl-CoA/(S)-citramalyl-CoA lyase
MARICNACRANGLRPMDGPFTDLADQEGYEVSARRARALGYEGKWAIHPKQIAIANAVFSPTTAEVAWARQVTDAMRSAIKEGNGAAQYEGRMIDLAHVRQAEDVLTKQELVRAAEG